jgi:DNA (cytosine-5)-methyltransferase 1
MQLTVGSLFSGIGGFDYGLEKAGMKVIWQSEIDPYSSAVLKKHWPNIPNIGDITKIDWNTIKRPNILCGGYPCQPFSFAGFRKGNNDPRHLWPEFKKAIRILRPDYTIMENVRGHLNLGFKEVLKDLTDIGYNAEWQVIPASTVNAPHKRERLIIVAYAKSGNERNTESQSMVTSSKQTTKFRKQNSTKKPKIYRWKSEPNVGRVADGIPFRVDRLKGLGNALVPQVAEYVGKLIIAHS